MEKNALKITFCNVDNHRAKLMEIKIESKISEWSLATELSRMVGMEVFLYLR